MTNENQTKQKPAFYIFSKDASGKSSNVGAAFKRQKGKGFNVIIAGKWYTAFEPKAQPVEGESA